MDGLAEKFYVSKYYLCRDFKEITDHSVKDYIMRQQPSYFKALLANITMLIVDGAEKRIFQYQAVYCIFRAREEISPAIYRRISKQLRSKKKEEKGPLPLQEFIRPEKYSLRERKRAKGLGPSLKESLTRCEDYGMEFCFI